MKINNQKGFTLLELMVAMAIMAVLSFATSQSLRSSSQLKSKLQGQIDRQALFRSAIRIMKRDVHLAFNHRDITIEILTDIKSREKELLAASNSSETGTGTSDANKDSDGDGIPDSEDEDNGDTDGGSGEDTKSNEQGSGVAPAEGEESSITLFEIEKYQKEITDPTSFIGENNELHFTNTNNFRVTPSDLATSQQEVGYYVKNCRNRLDPTKNYNCLWRRTSSNIDDDVTQGGDEFVLLENVTVFKVRYFGEGLEDWVENWYSNERGDERTKGKFPHAVEISIAFKDEQDKLAEAVFVANVAFPNNPKKKEEKDGLSTEGLQ